MVKLRKICRSCRSYIRAIIKPTNESSCVDKLNFSTITVRRLLMYAILRGNAEELEILVTNSIQLTHNVFSWTCPDHESGDSSPGQSSGMCNVHRQASSSTRLGTEDVDSR